MSLISSKQLKMILALSLILTLARCPSGSSSDSSAALLGLLGGGGGSSASNTADTMPQCTAALCLNGNVSGLISGASLVIANGGKTYTLPENGSFGLNAQTGDNYTITVQTQPTTLRCIVTNGTGTVGAVSVNNVVVTCPMAYKNNLVWNRCTHGQQWNATAGDCTGTGNSGNNYGATTVQYCSTQNNACNDSTSGGETNVTGHLNGGGTSSLYTACNGLGLGGRSWRVPWKNELKQIVHCSNGTPIPLNDFSTCGGGALSPTIDSTVFPNTLAAQYWSSSVFADATGFNGWHIHFNSGISSLSNSVGESIQSLYYVRCVSTGP